MSRVLRTAALAATAAVVAFGASACDSGTSTDASAKSSASTTASAPASATAGTDAPGSAPTTGTPVTSEAAGAKPDPASPQAPSTGNKPAAATVGRCHTAGLRFSFGNGDATYGSADDQQHLQVLMTNTSGSTCTVKGFPGVDLKAADSWSLVRTSKSPATVTLTSGASASFVITYQPFEAGSGVEFKAKSVVITPPSETTSVTLTWPGGSVLRQDGATHPATYVGPVTTS
ncbi:DUF4232 domain-containing protein [Streptomyces sp. NBC_01190]|uniref:DUF4232 domain-containing protein n=1 Tax=Streptomyces sp. NBC_01190 TaxID=2903767 RepID=UPI0038632369|nr:DUF4232 domain-containing protein [Streptomyces sp. NBC_01190]